MLSAGVAALPGMVKAAALQFMAQYHNFTLAESRDFLYNAAGRSTRRSSSGAAGRDVGDEIDFLANFHLSQHQDVLVGYSKLFAGDFIKKTMRECTGAEIFESCG